MKTKDFAKIVGADVAEVELFLQKKRVSVKYGISGTIIDDNDVDRCEALFKEYLIEKEAEEKEKQEKEKERKEQAAKEEEALAKKREAFEQLKKKVIMSSCSSIDGYTATKQMGIVFGEVVFKIGFLKSISAAISNVSDVFTPGDRELSGTMRQLETAREYAINKMIEEAVSKGANAVIGIDSESSFGGDVMHISIYGTAVYLEKNE